MGGADAATGESGGAGAYQNLKAVVRYDGTGFHGWQVQPGRRTVQGTIETALAQIASAPVRIHGSGRTDTGVHALGQVCSFYWPGAPNRDTLRRSLCKMLGPEIRIESIDPVPPGFHARKSAVGKRYAYCLAHARFPDPFLARYAWTVPWDVTPEALARLARRIEGRHDFAGFQAGKASVQSTVRTLHSVRLLPGGVVAPHDAAHVWRIAFHADGFLYKMVRNLTGTLVDIARGRLPESRIDECFGSPGPFHGHTAPPHGLFLLDVDYG